MLLSEGYLKYEKHKLPANSCVFAFVCLLVFADLNDASGGMYLGTLFLALLAFDLLWLLQVLVMISCSQLVDSCASPGSCCSSVSAFSCPEWKIFVINADSRNEGWWPLVHAKCKPMTTCRFSGVLVLTLRLLWLWIKPGKLSNVCSPIFFLTLS